MCTVFLCVHTMSMPILGIFNVRTDVDASAGLQQPKSSTTRSYQYVQRFSVSKQWYGCQCLGIVNMCNMLMHVIAHRGCAEKIPATPGHQTCIGILPSFRSDALPTEISCPAFVHLVCVSLLEWLYIYASRS